MTNARRKPPYWRRAKPKASYDIAKLRPPTLTSGKRFETLSDARNESRRREAMLTAYRAGNKYSRYLQECRNGDYDCERTYCPKCARTFRRHLIGQLLRLNSESHVKVQALVILLEAAPKGNLQKLQIERYRHSLRKQLERVGLSGVPVVGGFELIYRSRMKQWVLHINLVMFGGDEDAVANFEDVFRNGDLYRAAERTVVEDPAEQLSYVLKFTTYHRPHKQTGSKKPGAKPLNPAEHFELVRWMARYEFSDHLFLFNARRRGASIEPSNKEARKE
jgi:hypothetical protein